MNHFAKALKSFNKRAVLQKAAVGKPEGSWVNKKGQNVVPAAGWDFVSGPGIALTSKPESVEDGSRLGMFAGIDPELRYDLEFMLPDGKKLGDATLEDIRELVEGKGGFVRRGIRSINPIHTLRGRELPLSTPGAEKGRPGMTLLRPEHQAIIDRINDGVVSESTTESGDIGCVPYFAEGRRERPNRSQDESSSLRPSDLYCRHFGVDPNKFRSATTLGDLLNGGSAMPCSAARQEMFAGTALNKILSGRDELTVRPALKISYEEAYTLLRLHLYDKMKKNGLEYRAMIFSPYTPAKHPPFVRKVFMPYLQELLNEGADHLVPYFAEKFGTAF